MLHSLPSSDILEDEQLFMKLTIEILFLVFIDYFDNCCCFIISELFLPTDYEC